MTPGAEGACAFRPFLSPVDSAAKDVKEMELKAIFILLHVLLLCHKIYKLPNAFQAIAEFIANILIIVCAIKYLKKN